MQQRNLTSGRSESGGHGLSFALAGGQLALGDRHDQVLLGHERIFGDKVREAQTEARFLLELVEYSPVVVVRVRKDPVHAPAHRAQLRHRRFLD